MVEEMVRNGPFLELYNIDQETLYPAMKRDKISERKVL